MYCGCPSLAVFEAWANGYFSHCCFLRNAYLLSEYAAIRPGAT
jgi:hypothetical protein